MGLEGVHVLRRIEKSRGGTGPMTTAKEGCIEAKRSGKEVGATWKEKGKHLKRSWDSKCVRDHNYTPLLAVFAPDPSSIVLFPAFRDLFCPCTKSLA